MCIYQVVDAGAVPLLVLCVQEPELSLKRISASALSDICKHSPELAQTVVDAGAIAHLAQMILNPDAKLKVCIMIMFTLTVPGLLTSFVLHHPHIENINYPK